MLWLLLLNSAQKECRVRGCGFPGRLFQLSDVREAAERPLGCDRELTKRSKRSKILCLPRVSQTGAAASSHPDQSAQVAPESFAGKMCSGSKWHRGNVCCWMQQDMFSLRLQVLLVNNESSSRSYRLISRLISRLIFSMTFTFAGVVKPWCRGHQPFLKWVLPHRHSLIQRATSLLHWNRSFLSLSYVLILLLILILNIFMCKAN